MRLRDILSLAAHNLRESPLRTALCELSVAVGSGALLLILSIGLYGRKQVDVGLQTLGVSGLSVYTESGHAGTILSAALADEIEQDVDGIRTLMPIKAQSGTVRVGTLNSLLTASFSNIVPLYHERFPHVQISLHAGNIASITEMLVKNELDIIYTLDEQIFDTQFVKVFEAQEDVVIVTNTENPLSARDDVHLADLVSHPFILMNHGNPYRDQFDRELARQDLSVEPFLELESDTLALKLIRENPEYLSVLPRYTAKMSIHKGNLSIIPVADCQMSQWRQVLYHRNKVITPQIQGMLDVILEVAKKPF